MIREIKCLQLTEKLIEKTQFHSYFNINIKSLEIGYFCTESNKMPISTSDVTLTHSISQSLYVYCSRHNGASLQQSFL